nr:MAG TPA: hypothetical protein [Caudoviricetes sp.]DAY37484.1 MAG TPA: hypothetical protein [Caudoviricetes sp.]
MRRGKVRCLIRDVQFRSLDEIRSILELLYITIEDQTISCTLN